MTIHTWDFAMPSYRLYYLSANNHITSAEVVVADDDEAAQAQAAVLCAHNHRPVEIWRGPQMLAAYSQNAAIGSAAQDS
jgi:hypothetical protein